MLLSLLRDENRDLGYDYGEDNEEQVQSCLETAAKFISGHVGEVRSIEDRWTVDVEELDLTFLGYSDLTAGKNQMNDEGEKIGEQDAIFDWKTGKKASPLEEKIQAGVYIELYKEEFGEVPEMFIFVYLKEGEISIHRRVSDDGRYWSKDSNKYFDTVMDYSKQIVRAEMKDDWEAKGSGSDCYWCDYKYLCSDSPIGAENVEVHNIGGI